VHSNPRSSYFVSCPLLHVCLSFLSILSFSLSFSFLLPKDWSSLLLAPFSRTASRCARASYACSILQFFSNDRVIKKYSPKISQDDIVSALLFSDQFESCRMKNLKLTMKLTNPIVCITINYYNK